LDAQYFGVPQRRRRVFVISCFDSAIAAKCPDQILTVGQGRGGDSSTSEPTGESVASTTTDSIGNGSWWNGKDIADTITGTSNEQRMPDKNKLQMVVVEPFTPSSHAGYSDGIGTLRANGGDLGGGSETLLAFNAQPV